MDYTFNVFFLSVIQATAIWTNFVTPAQDKIFVILQYDENRLQIVWRKSPTTVTVIMAYHRVEEEIKHTICLKR